MGMPGFPPEIRCAEDFSIGLFKRVWFSVSKKVKFPETSTDTQFTSIYQDLKFTINRVPMGTIIFPSPRQALELEANERRAKKSWSPAKGELLSLSTCVFATLFKYFKRIIYLTFPLVLIYIYIYV